LAVFSGFPVLCRLALGNAGDGSLRSLPRSLRELELTDCTVTDAGVATLGGLDRLQTLDCQACVQLTDLCVTALAALPSLCALSLAHCTQFTAAGLASLAASSSLRSLDLRGCGRVGWEVSMKLAAIHVQLAAPVALSEPRSQTGPDPDCRPGNCLLQ
jgi:hypothetical protein